MELSEILALARVSRESAALMTGVSKQSIDNWCSGRAAPRLEHMSRLALALLRQGTASQRDIRAWATGELSRSGMDPEVLSFICDSGRQPSDRPVVVIGSGSFTSSFQTMARAIAEESRTRGESNIVYLDFCGRTELLMHYLELLRKWCITGAILVGLPLSEAEFTKIGEDVGREAPCVFIQNGPNNLPPGCAFVSVGNEEAATIVTETLWSRGHRKIVAIAIDGSNTRSSQRGRIKGYRTATEHLSVECRVLLASSLSEGHTFGPPSDKPELREAIDLLVADDDYTAFIPLSAHATKQLMRALNRRGMMPGRDVAVMTMGCWDWMHYVSRPPLSHLPLPYSEAGRRAISIVLDVSTGKYTSREPVVVELHPGKDSFHFVEHGTISEMAVTVG